MADSSTRAVKKNKLINAKRRTIIVLLGLIAVTALIVFFEYIFGGRLFAFYDIGSDTSQQYLTHYMTIVRKLREGDLTLWDANNGFGVNMNMLNMTNPALMIIYVLGFFFGETSVPYLIVYVYILEIAAAGVGCYLFLSTFPLREKAKLPAAYMYAFSGFMMVWGQHYQFAIVPVLLIFEMLMIELCVREPKRWKGLTLMSCLVVLNSMYIAYMILLFTGFYVVLRFLMRRLTSFLDYVKDVFRLAWAMGLGVGLGMVTLLPAIAAIMGVSSRLQSEESLLRRLTKYSYGKEYFHILIARFFSSSMKGVNDFCGVSNFYEESNLFFSTLFVFLIVQYVFIIPTAKSLTRKQKFLHYGVLAAAGLILTTPVPSIIMNGLTLPFCRYMFVYTPYFAMIAAFTLNEIFTRRRVNMPALVLAFAAALFYYVKYLLPGNGGTNPRFVTGLHLMGSIAMAALLFLFGFRKVRQYRRLIYWGLVGTLALNLAVDGLGVTTGRDTLFKGGTYMRECRDQDTIEALAYIKENDPEYFRTEKTYGATIAMDGLIFGYHPVSTYNSTQNMFVQFYVRDFWNDLLYADVNHYIYTMGISNRGQSDLVGVKYVLARTKDADIYGAEILKTFGDVTVYRCTEVDNIASFYDEETVMSRHELEPDELTHKVVVDYNERMRDAVISIPETGKDDTIVGTVKAPKDGFVFIAIPYEAGWSVTVDGAPAERWKGCEGFTAFKVPAGEHEFRMHYLVPGLKKGILLSVFSVILFVLFSFIGKKRGDTEPLAFVLSFVKRRRES